MFSPCFLHVYGGFLSRGSGGSQRLRVAFFLEVLRSQGQRKLREIGAGTQGTRQGGEWSSLLIQEMVNDGNSMGSMGLMVNNGNH